MRIVEYQRPETVEDAIRLLSREAPKTVALMGADPFLHQESENVAVVDLQALGLETITKKARSLEIGAMVTLQALMGAVSGLTGLVSAILHEATYNRRQMITVAGSLVDADGRSPFATAMLSLDAQLVYLPGDQIEPVGTLFSLPGQIEKDRLISRILIPNEVRLVYQYVARTPADLPIVCVSVVQWPSGRTRVAVGGFGRTPKLVMDGPNPSGAEIAAKDAYQEAGDVWASALYRREIAATLTKRCLTQLEQVRP